MANSFMDDKQVIELTSGTYNAKVMSVGDAKKNADPSKPDYFFIRYALDIGETVFERITLDENGETFFNRMVKATGASARSAKQIVGKPVAVTVVCENGYNNVRNVMHPDVAAQIDAMRTASEGSAPASAPTSEFESMLNAAVQS